MDKPLQAYDGDDAFVFVCYAHADSEVVFREITWLHEADTNIWYDEGISIGHEWTQEIVNAIERCNKFLYFVTPASVETRHCRNEVQYALDSGKDLVAVHLEETELPGGLHLAIGLTQALLKYDLSPPEYDRQLLDALQKKHPHSFRSSTRVQHRAGW